MLSDLNDPSYRNVLIDLRAGLYQALANQRGERVVPFTEKKAQGLRFRRRQGSGSAQFPPSFIRDADADDLVDGFFPPERLPDD